MSLEIVFMIAGVAINSLIALYIYRQVRIADISNQQHVMPVMGLIVDTTLGSEIARDIQSKQLKPILGEKAGKTIRLPVKVLKVYVQFNIAKNISCEILKNGEFFYGFKNKKSAIPPKDGKIIICEKNISEIIRALSKEEEIEFVANFTFQSVLDGEFACEYRLRTGKYMGQQNAELEFLKYPWKRK